MSEKVDITLEPEFSLRCLLSVFSNKPSGFGYPLTKEVPGHLVAQGKTRHVIETAGQLFCLDQQIAGSRKDHLVGRGTVAWKARLMSQCEIKMTKFFCVEASWTQMGGNTKGIY